MNSRRTYVIGVLLATGLSAVFALGQAQPTPPDLSGKWTLVNGAAEADSPLGRDGTIAQNGTTVTLKPSTSTRSIAIPFNGSKTTSQGNGPVVWEYQGRWVGFAFVVSMKATSGAFEDLMVMTRSGPDTMTMVLMRTPVAAGKVMHSFTLTYRKS